MFQLGVASCYRILLCFPRIRFPDSWIGGWMRRLDTMTLRISVCYSFGALASAFRRLVFPLSPAVQGRQPPKRRLPLAAVVVVEVPMQGLHHGLVVLETDGLEHFAYPAVEAFDHPARLGVISLCEPVVDAMFLAGLIEQVVPGRSPAAAGKPVGEARPVIDQHVGYGECEEAGTTVQEGHSLPDARFGIHVDGGQAGEAVNGHKQQAALAPQFRQVLDVDVEIARGIAFEAFGCWRLSRQRSSTFCGSASHPPANDTHCLFRCVEYEAAAHRPSHPGKTRWISSPHK